jgi:hypothetical protein
VLNSDDHSRNHPHHCQSDTSVRKLGSPI